MRRLLTLMLMSTLAITGCGDSATSGGSGGGGTTDPVVSSLGMSSSSSQIAADGTTPVTITAQVLDQNGLAMEGETVEFSTSAGDLSASSGTSDSSGLVSVDLTVEPGATAETVTVTGTAGAGVTNSVDLELITRFLDSIDLLTSNLQLQSDGTTPVTLTAFVRDQNNNFLADVPVTFSATSGGISVVQGTTGANGLAEANLNTAGDPTNRTVTVTATATDPNGLGTLTDTIDIAITGTSLSISGDSAVVLTDTVSYTAELEAADGSGIGSIPVEFTSANGNTLSATSVDTNNSGQAQVNLTASEPGNDTLTAEALGETASFSISVSPDDFRFISPDSNTEVDLGATETVTLQWLDAGTPVTGETINFETTNGRGTLTVTQVVTDGTGQAAVDISSSQAGPGGVKAVSDSEGLSTSIPLEFVATDPDQISVQADPNTVGPEEDSTITVILEDPAGNLVKNERILFSLDDSTGGALSAGSATTDSSGRAQVVYTAANATSATDGVEITATVESEPAVTDTATLTVARRPVFITVGTGNEIIEPDSTRYQKTFTVLVTDASGNGVANVDLTMDLHSTEYRKGLWILGVGGWSQFPAITCDDEDVDQDGNLDAGEDTNNNGSIEAGNVAAVTPTNVTTDEDGFAIIDLLYPQEFAQWVRVRLSASTTVNGTESTETTRFWLPISADDLEQDVTPPGQTSPFGLGWDSVDTSVPDFVGTPSCADTN